MEVQTREFGVIEVEEDAVYQFPNGVYGFEEEHQFAIFSREIEGYTFLYLQSTASLFPCFMVFEPWDMHDHYEPKLSQDDLSECQVEHLDDLIFLVIATVPANIQELSINIKSPIVLNPKTRKAKQVIVQNPDYGVRYYPFLESGKDGTSC